MKHIHSLISFCFLTAFILGCSQHGLLRSDGSSDPQRRWNWGGEPGRCGLSAEEIVLPMDLAWIHKAQSGVERALCAFDESIVVGTKNGTLLVLNQENGRPVKRIRKKKAGVTCALDGSRLMTAQRWGESVVEAIDLRTLKLEWSVSSGFVEGEPLVLNDRIIVVNVKGVVYCFDAIEGKRLWSRRLGSRVTGSPASADHTVFIATEDGSIWSLAFHDGSVHWRRRMKGTFISSCVTDDRFLYIGSKEGRFYAFNAAGGDTVWEVKTDGGIFEAAACDDEFVYYGTSRGTLVCRHACTGAERWQFRTKAAAGASPLVTGDYVVFGNLDGKLFLVDNRSGEAVWQYKAKGRIRTTPLVWNGMLICASEDEYVYAFKSAM